METASPTNSMPLVRRLVFGRNPVWTVVRILFVVFISLVAFKFVLVPIRVTGESMFPTYQNREIKFVNRLAYWRHEPERGDVVAVELNGQQVLLLKRIVALPGETFSIHNGDLYVNKKKLPEAYAFGKIPYGKGYGSLNPIKLGPSEYVILGDNRKISEGYFKYRKEIIGKVF